MTFLSKYFSRAKENKKSENIEISNYGMKVNSAKYVIYFLLDLRPSLSISFLIALLVSTNIKINKRNNKTILRMSKSCRFLSDNSIKPLSIKVKKVKKPTDNVIINRNIKYMFFLIKLAIFN